MKTKILVAAMCGVGLFASVPAQATILSSYLTFDGVEHHTNPTYQGGGEDLLEDNSRTAWIDQDGDSEFSVGDIVWGHVMIDHISASPAAFSQALSGDARVSIIFSAEITGYDAVNKLFTLDAVSDTSSDYYLGNMIAGDLSAQGIDKDTVGVVLSRNWNNDDPINWSTDDVNYSDGDGKYTAANGWGWEATLGLVSPDDFFQFKGNASDGGTEMGGFTIQDQAFWVKSWTSVDVKDLAGVIHYNDATLDSGDVQIASGGVQALGWHYKDNGDYYVNPVPEPAGVALLGLGLAGLGFAGRRRRQSKA